MGYGGHTPLPFSIEEVAQLNGLNVTRNKCPFCGGRTSFGISRSKQMWNCMRCGEKGNAITLHAKLHNMSNSEAYKDIQNSLKNFSGVMTQPSSRPDKAESMCQIADIDKRDAVYRAMLEICKLDDNHKADMEKRGFLEKELATFGTFDIKRDNDRSLFARNLIKQGFHLEGIPGFYIDSTNSWTTAYSKRGILVPYVSFDNKVQGLQIRKDTKLLRRFSDGKLEHKYSWFSSGYIPSSAKPDSGTRATTFVHYACSFRYSEMKKSYVPEFTDGTFYLTEGAMKADLVHNITGRAYIAVPGVNALPQLEAELKKLRRIGVRRIINAYDMDYLTNEHVAEAVGKTETMIRDEGFEYNRMTWDTKNGILKGIDDYCAYYYRQNHDEE